MPLMIMIFKMIHNAETTLKYESLKTYQDLKTSKYMLKENLKIYQSLEEGIITFKNNKIVFTNQIVEDIFMDLFKNSNRVFSFDHVKK